MNLSAKRKEFLKKLFGQNSNHILSAMSSAYCENEEKDFEEMFGLNFKDARNAVEAFIYHINHL